MLPCGSSLIYGFNDTAGILSFRINPATHLLLKTAILAEILGDRKQ
ncbi:hypothetical protein [Nostoc sp.]